MIGMTTVWLSASFGYYLIGYQLKYVKGDFWINNIVSAVSEVIAYLISGIFFNVIGLKPTLYVSYAISLAGMLCLILVNTSDVLFLSLFILGSKFGISQVFNIAFVGNQHLFPIALVSTTMGICNFFARVATIFAPYVAELHPPQISMWTFVGVVGLSFIASMFIKDKKRPQS